MSEAKISPHPLTPSLEKRGGNDFIEIQIIPPPLFLRRVSNNLRKPKNELLGFLR